MKLQGRIVPNGALEALKREKHEQPFVPVVSLPKEVVQMAAVPTNPITGHSANEPFLPARVARFLDDSERFERAMELVRTGTPIQPVLESMGLTMSLWYRALNWFEWVSEAEITDENAKRWLLRIEDLLVASGQAFMDHVQDLVEASKQDLNYKALLIKLFYIRQNVSRSHAKQKSEVRIHGPNGAAIEVTHEN